MDGVDGCWKASLVMGNSNVLRLQFDQDIDFIKHVVDKWGTDWVTVPVKRCGDTIPDSSSTRVVVRGVAENIKGKCAVANVLVVRSGNCCSPDSKSNSNHLK